MKNPIKPLEGNIRPLKKDTADFVQFTRGYLKETRDLAKKSLPAFMIFNFLTERMTRQNAIVVSQKTLMEILELGRTSIQQGIKVLQEGNWVQVVKIGQSNGYLVNAKVVWRSHQNKRYGHFTADVIISEAEQTQSVEELENQPLRDIPNVKKGEMPISDNADLPPPDQRELFEPDFDTIPHTKAEDS